MSRRYTMRSKAEKLEIVKQVLAGTPERAWESQGINRRQVHDWTKLYLGKGESGLELKKKPGNPHDNAVMESFWGRFMDTLRKHFRYRERDDLRTTIEQAIYYFNYERPVRKFKGKPPVLFRTELVA